MEKYILSWDKTAILTTLFCILILCGVCFLAIKYRGWVRWIMVLIGIITFVTPLFLFPRYMTKDADRILIHFIGYKKELRLSDYESVSLKKDGMRGLVRTCASDGYFGYWGKWKDSSGRKYTSYVMDKSKDIYILTPKNNKDDLIIINRPYDWLKSIAGD
ncbi:MAG: hypothetical protein Q4E10_01635 [Porphyromonas sp.]|nr:hypothetical protein [Porphyromonas sp.]